MGRARGRAGGRHAARRRQVLVLGASQPALGEGKSVGQIAEMVRGGDLESMDGRDGARMRALAMGFDVEVFTVSQQNGDYCDRHLGGSFNDLRLIRGMKRKWKEPRPPRFLQVYLDYFWNPNGSWTEEHWKKEFVRDFLPSLVKEGLLDFGDLDDVKYDPELEAHVSAAGVVYLPFCERTLTLVVANEVELSKNFTISFVHKDDLGEHMLHKATNSISEKMMRDTFEKDIAQEEIWCTLNKNKIRNGHGDDSVTWQKVEGVRSRIDRADGVRMIKLMANRGLKWGPDCPESEREGKDELGWGIGGYVGLDPETRKRRLPQREVAGPDEEGPRRKRAKKAPTTVQNRRARRVAKEASVAASEASVDDGSEYAPTQGEAKATKPSPRPTRRSSSPARRGTRNEAAVDGDEEANAKAKVDMATRRSQRRGARRADTPLLEKKESEAKGGRSPDEGKGSPLTQAPGTRTGSDEATVPPLTQAVAPAAGTRRSRRLQHTKDGVCATVDRDAPADEDSERELTTGALVAESEAEEPVALAPARKKGGRGSKAVAAKASEGEGRDAAASRRKGKAGAAKKAPVAARKKPASNVERSVVPAAAKCAAEEASVAASEELAVDEEAKKNPRQVKVGAARLDNATSTDANVLEGNGSSRNGTSTARESTSQTLDGAKSPPGRKQPSEIGPPNGSPQTQKKRKRQHGQPPNVVQLFNFDVAQEQFNWDRPKRRIKAICSFDPTYRKEKESDYKCKIGEGFDCPRCHAECSYDSRQCAGCQLDCCYEAGVGVVVVQQRRIDYTSSAKAKKRAASPEKMGAVSPSAEEKAEADKAGEDAEGSAVESDNTKPSANELGEAKSKGVEANNSLNGGGLAPEKKKRGRQKNLKGKATNKASEEAGAAKCQSSDIKAVDRGSKGLLAESPPGLKEPPEIGPPNGSPQTQKKRKRQHNQPPNDVQLFNFDVAQEQFNWDRPKRRIKAICSFDPTYRKEKESDCKVGEGFDCPQCHAECSYDSRQCPGCQLDCCYEAGVGVVVVQQRRIDYTSLAKGKKRAASPEKMGAVSSKKVDNDATKTPETRPRTRSSRANEATAAKSDGAQGENEGRKARRDSSKGRDKSPDALEVEEDASSGGKGGDKARESRDTRSRGARIEALATDDSGDDGSCNGASGTILANRLDDTTSTGAISNDGNGIEVGAARLDNATGGIFEGRSKSENGNEEQSTSDSSDDEKSDEEQSEPGSSNDEKSDEGDEDYSADSSDNEKLDEYDEDYCEPFASSPTPADSKTAGLRNRGRAGEMGAARPSRLDGASDGAPAAGIETPTRKRRKAEARDWTATTARRRTRKNRKLSEERWGRLDELGFQLIIDPPTLGKSIGMATPVKGDVTKSSSTAAAPAKKSFAKSSFKTSGAGGAVPGSGGPTVAPEVPKGAEAAAVEMEGASRKASRKTSATPPSPPQGTEPGPVAAAKSAPAKKSFAKSSFKTSPSSGTVPGAYRVGGVPPPPALAREVPKGVEAAAAEMEGSSRKATSSPSPVGDAINDGQWNERQRAEKTKAAEDRLQISFARASGAGGQNVNKVNTKYGCGGGNAAGGDVEGGHDDAAGGDVAVGGKRKRAANAKAHEIVAMLDKWYAFVEKHGENKTQFCDEIGYHRKQLRRWLENEERHREDAKLMADGSDAIASDCAASENGAQAMEGITTLSENDIILGRGGICRKHQGNVAYRALVARNSEFYATCPKEEKTKVSKSIVAALREIGARFVEPEDGKSTRGVVLQQDMVARDEEGNPITWRDVGDKRVIEKTSQALREKQPQLLKKLGGNKPIGQETSDITKISQILREMRKGGREEAESSGTIGIGLVELRFHVDSAEWIPAEVRDRLKSNEGNRINSQGFLTVTSQEHQTQLKNRKDAVKKLEDMLWKSWARDPIERWNERWNERFEQLKARLVP
ncbi:hypothetical protein ACHAXT_005895 [Thalassiosira profunda]